MDHPNSQNARIKKPKRNLVNRKPKIQYIPDMQPLVEYGRTIDTVKTVITLVVLLNTSVQFVTMKGVMRNQKWS
jgi:hypothetical protein